MRYPYTLFKVKSKVGIMWHARFWNETQQRYAHSKTTGILAEGKKENRREAEDAAKKLYAEYAEQQKINQQSVSKIQSVANTPLIEYLENFWSETSEYTIFKRDTKGESLSKNYIKNNHNAIRLHVKPFHLFTDVTVGTLTKAMLKKWMIWLSGRHKTRTKKDGTVIDEGKITGRRGNSIMQSVRVAIRWAYDNEEIQIDPFHKLGDIIEVDKEKGVLTFEERAKLANLPITKKNYRTRLFMLLGSFCGLRRGEMRGLQWGDISNGLITVQHNYINGEGIKLPKWNSTRTVPITSEVQKFLDLARGFAKNTNPNDFVLESPKEKGKPLSNNFFRDRFDIALLNIGISLEQQVERFLSCHSLRHTFVTLAELQGLPDVVVRALAGHKNAKTQKRYSHAPQVIDFDEARRKLETPCIANMPTTKTA